MLFRSKTHILAMKNLILTLFLVMPLFITAQNGIAFNQTENGYRMVAAKSVAVKNGKKDNMPIKYALSVIAKDGDVEWSLLLSIQDVNPFVIAQGDIMKVFLPDEKVYDLHQSLPDHDTVDNTGVYNKKAALRIYTMIARSEERRAGKECLRLCRFRWSL